MADDKPNIPKAMQALLKRGAPRSAVIGPGSTIGKYHLLEEIGKGGHGAVYRATDDTGALVAVKVLHGHVISDQLKLRMKREAYAMSQLTGTAAATVYECNESSSGQLYLAMELLDGRDLRGVIEAYEARGQRMPIHVILQLLEPIVQTLQIAHERGIIHRDLKPENIFVLQNGSVRLVDFGLVKDLNLAQLTDVGTIAGSPGYIAPEAWNGQPDQIDHRIDVYALGVLLFQLLTGTRPFEAGDNLFDFIILVSKAPRPSLRALRPDLPPAIDTWSARALAARREDRFQTVIDLWASFVAIVTGR